LSHGCRSWRCAPTTTCESSRALGERPTEKRQMVDATRLCSQRADQDFSQFLIAQSDWVRPHAACLLGGLDQNRNLGVRQAVRCQPRNAQ